MPVAATRARSRLLPAVLIMLAAGLGPLAPAWQPAFAASQVTASISAGGNHSCAIEGGAAYCWGTNADGELGNGTTGGGSAIPVAVSTSGVLAGRTLIQIAVGDTDACALASTGTAYCWGSNQDGELGNGTTTSSSVPVAVSTSGVLAGQSLTQIAAGDGYTCAVASSGAAYCWGLNSWGGLGDGSYADSSVPVAVSTSGVLAGRALVQITAASFGHTCALDSAGAAYCWGINSDGEIGTGSASAAGSNVPVAVSTSGVLAGKTLTQIGTGEFHTCALASTGAAYCWGLNSAGELGNGSTTDASAPVPVTTSGVLAGKTLTQIGTGGGNYTCAVDTAGASYCWGANVNGGLGNGGTASSTVPVAVTTSGVLAGKALTQVGFGYYHTCAQDAAGAAYCWGDNIHGDLGQRGLSGQSDVPVLAGPQAPTGVTASPAASGALVSWTAPASLDGGRLTGYTATASPGGAACTTRSTTCTISGLSGGTTYQVTVVAHTSAGDSGASAPAEVSPGTPGPIVSGYRSTKCVEDLGDSAADGTAVVIWSCDGSAGQSWALDGDGTIRANGKCMSIRGGSQASKAAVELDTCAGRASQQWQAANGTLVNPVSGKCLDDPRLSIADGTQLDIYPCNGGAGQQWRLP
jgi:alpha-tubulin suppressor-like RCC1 family protein